MEREFCGQASGRPGSRGKSVLLTGDGFSPVIEASLSKLLLKRGAERPRLDALKLPHHGSKGNTSSHLLDLLRCVDDSMDRGRRSRQERHPAVLIAAGCRSCYFVMS
ncbi:hypothetical protein [Desulforhabdus sp. TSK]|uniref:hypothetical protein n=1 Tax=Desulforhabdus sp. TSK TaxID=2925014 RepID=UPI001FC807F0|nr:hypothetical protein [Desulforhabdus sp. TSK]